MNLNSEKIQKLTDIARLYYEQDKTQNEIAKLYGISRPLISRFLKEARDCGIVHIEIRSPLDDKNLLLTKLQAQFHMKGAVTIPAGNNDNITNLALAEEALRFIRTHSGGCFGIGWGTAIGVVVSLLEQQPAVKGVLKSVCPLVGNSGVSNRNYHTNENVRVFSQQLGAYPYYLYTPAFAESLQEMELIKKLENYHTVLNQWNNLDIALVNIGNYPSVPDFASGARYGALLSERKAAGRILAYYYDGKGEIIQSGTDYAIQIPVEQLRCCNTVIGICSANVNARALLGAMRTGLLDYILVSDKLLKEAITLSEGKLE